MTTPAHRNIAIALPSTGEEEWLALRDPAEVVEAACAEMQMDVVPCAKSGMKLNGKGARKNRN